MVIDVSVQYNGGFLPEIRNYTVDPMLLPSGNPFKCHEEVLSLQPMFPPKPFDCSGGLAAFRSPMVVTLGQRYNVGEKPTVILNKGVFKEKSERT